MENPFKKIKRLEKEIEGLKARELSAVRFVKSIIKDLEWYDYKKLEKQQWSEYYAGAQAIINSEVFKNEIKFYLQEIVLDIASNSADHNETMNKRTGMIFLESFKERLELIQDPKVEENKDNIYEAI